MNERAIVGRTAFVPRAFASVRRHPSKTFLYVHKQKAFQWPLTPPTPLVGWLVGVDFDMRYA